MRLPPAAANPSALPYLSAVLEVPRARRRLIDLTMTVCRIHLHTLWVAQTLLGVSLLPSCGTIRRASIFYRFPWFRNRLGLHSLAAMQTPHFTYIKPSQFRDVIPQQEWRIRG